MIRSLGTKTPKIHPDAFVSEAAYVVGDVEIGEGSSIWPGVVIRANHHKIKIGKFVNIQDNAVIHSDEEASYGDHVTIGHSVMSHASSVEEYCLIGNGAVVNSYSNIGHHSLVGSGAVVLEQVVIPPGSLVLGAPAAVKREVMERPRELIDRIWKEYWDNAQEFKKSGLQDPDQDKFTDPNV